MWNESCEAYCFTVCTFVVVVPPKYRPNMPARGDKPFVLQNIYTMSIMDDSQFSKSPFSCSLLTMEAE